MRQAHLLHVAAIVQLLSLTVFTEPGAAQSNPPSPQAESVTGDNAEERSAHIAAFLADTEGKQAHDFPAWNDYREVVGDSQASRAVFADMLKAEPKLLAVIGGDPKQLAETLAERLAAHIALFSENERTTETGLTYRQDRIAFKSGTVGYRITLENLATVVLVAGRSDAARHFGDNSPSFGNWLKVASNDGDGQPHLPTDSEVWLLVYRATIMEQMWRKREHRPGPDQQTKLTPYQQRQDALTDRIEGYVEPEDAPARTRRSTFLQRWDVLERLMTRWAAREGRPKHITARLEAAMGYGLEEAKLPIVIELLRRGESIAADSVTQMMNIEPSTEFAIVMLGRLGKKQHAGLLAPYLDNHRGLRIQSMRQPYVNFKPQLRDLALAALVQLNGTKPEEYGFRVREGSSWFFRERPASFYVFDTVDERNRAFGLCVKNFKELGLQRPPRFTPEMPPRFLFVSGRVPKPLATSPDRKIRLSLEGNKARLIDVATEKQIGKQLSAGKRNNGQDYIFTCYSFSPDGKYVVTGAGFVQNFPNQSTRPTNVGQIEVWDAATGESVEKIPPGRRGRVQAVGFSSDGKAIHYDAEKFSLDIS